jgi:hypothetical protein
MPLRDNDSGNIARQLLNDKKLLIELAVRGYEVDECW